MKKNNVSSFKYSREFRVSNLDSYKVGSEVKVNNFIEGQFVDVCSNSIGKGFAGGMKRHNFAGNRATHGVSISHRSHGSTGQCQDPGKVFKGKKMAGRLGNKKITVQNLKVLKVDIDNNILLIKGAVPGHKGAVISVFDSVKKRQNIKPDQDNNFDQGSEVDAEVTPNLANDNIQEKKTEQVQAKIVEQNDPEDTKKTSENREGSENKDSTGLAGESGSTGLAGESGSTGLVDEADSEGLADEADSEGLADEADSEGLDLKNDKNLFKIPSESSRPSNPSN